MMRGLFEAPEECVVVVAAKRALGDVAVRMNQKARGGA
jgi:hypothetical protein